MNLTHSQNYHHIAAAINYLQKHDKTESTLEDLAKSVRLSPAQFQNILIEWAGVSPGQFLEFVSINYPKRILQNAPVTLFDTAYKTSLSGKGRLHHLYVEIESMAPNEHNNKGANLTINYSFAATLFGDVLVASTQKGICYMGFADQPEGAFLELKNRFPRANYSEQTDKFQENVLKIYQRDWDHINTIKLHLKGTDFQLKVWKALLEIPTSELKTYADIAHAIQKPNAARAVGTAIGGNPIAFLIPCHRVIQSSGLIGGYMWGSTRKTAIIGWEAALLHRNI